MCIAMFCKRNRRVGFRGRTRGTDGGKGAILAFKHVYLEMDQTRKRPDENGAHMCAAAPPSRHPSHHGRKIHIHVADSIAAVYGYYYWYSRSEMVVRRYTLYYRRQKDVFIKKKIYITDNIAALDDRI